MNGTIQYIHYGETTYSITCIISTVQVNKCVFITHKCQSEARKLELTSKTWCIKPWVSRVAKSTRGTLAISLQ